MQNASEMVFIFEWGRGSLQEVTGITEGEWTTDGFHYILILDCGTGGKFQPRMARMFFTGEDGGNGGVRLGNFGFETGVGGSPGRLAHVVWGYLAGASLGG